MGAVANRLFEQAFQDELLNQVEANPDTRSWSAAGRGKVKSRPQGEDGQWWRDNGPNMVQQWIDWRFESNWVIWTTPDGQAAIELDIIADCPTDDGRVIPVKMFIDRVMIMANKELCIVDLKSGSRTPDSDLQLAFYRYGIFQKYGIDIKYGTYWMARKGLPVDPFSLDRYSVELMEGMFKRFRKAVDLEIFLPHPSMKCRACSVNKFCAAFGGAFADRDPDHPDYGKPAEAVEAVPEVQEESKSEPTGEEIKSE